MAFTFNQFSEVTLGQKAKAAVAGASNVVTSAASKATKAVVGITPITRNTFNSVVSEVDGRLIEDRLLITKLYAHLGLEMPSDEALASQVDMVRLIESRKEEIQAAVKESAEEPVTPVVEKVEVEVVEQPVEFRKASIFDSVNAAADKAIDLDLL